MVLAEFSVWPALLGGALIGLAAALLMFFNGRVAGVSGILGQLVVGRDAAWRAMWMAGLLAGATAAFVLDPKSFGAPVHPSFALLLVAGGLVGVGTTLGSGCTSGHGVCGLSRLSLRSLVATVSFIASGALTVVVMRWLGALP